jgi:hypothetical protein
MELGSVEPTGADGPGCQLNQSASHRTVGKIRMLMYSPVKAATGNLDIPKQKPSIFMQSQQHTLGVLAGSV